MRLFLLAASAAAITAFGAAAQPAPANVAQTPSGETATPSPAAGVASTAPAPPNDAPSYLQQAGRGDLYEIQSSQLELSRGRDMRAKDFANRMIQDHTQSTQMLLTAARQAGLPAAPPAALDPRRQVLLDQLKTAPTPDFDRFYRDQQLVAHQEALALHQNYAKNGDTPALRPVAGQIAEVVQQHLSMLQGLGAR